MKEWIRIEYYCKTNKNADQLAEYIYGMHDDELSQLRVTDEVGKPRLFCNLEEGFIEVVEHRSEAK